MTHAIPAPLRRQPFDCLVQALILATLLAQGGPAAAGTLAQTPLTSRISDPPKPNLVITVDDSGSMNTQYMPEGRFKIRPGDPARMQVEFPSGRVTDANTWYMTDGFPGDTSKDDGWTTACVVPSQTGSFEALYQMQFRSPDVNSVFYNPDVRYLPWVKDSTSRFPAATLNPTLWEPTKAGSFKWLTTPNVLYTSGALNWCYSTYSISTTYGESCSGGNCTVAFRPGLVYRLKSATADPTSTHSYTRYDINVNGKHAPSVKHAQRTDCAGSRCTQLEEQRNFANWFTYYRSRMHLTKGALSEVLGQTRDNLRVGLANINQGYYPDYKDPLVVDGKRQNAMRVGVRDLSDAHRDELLVQLRSLTAAGYTPLKEALVAVGEYFQRNDNGNPWQSQPLDGSSAASQLACRRSYNILTTDGYYNGQDYADRGNVDNLANNTAWPPAPGFAVTGAPYGYTRARPYQDTYTGTLADLAMSYYINDLRTDIPNQIQPDSRRAKAPYWQHLTQFTVGIGVSGSLDSRPTQRQATLNALTAGTLNWPDPGASDAGKIDDLWHAAVNTGGDFFSVKNAPELTEALVTALDKVMAVERQEAGVAASSKGVAAGVLKFVPTYQSGSWSGDLLAYEMTQRAGQFTFDTTPKWMASAAVPAWNARQIYTWNGSNAVPFDTQLDSTTKALISSKLTLQDKLINYVRGNVSDEGRTAGLLRERNGKKLPDFLNATPTYVKGYVNLAYPDAWTPTAPYSRFVAEKQARKSGVIFVGGNGGMLHGFADANGAEMFAFVPRALLGNLVKLSQQDYGTASNLHQYFVDGELLETDAYIPTPRTAGAPAWTNLLIGTYGAGGKGVFALDVTALDNLGQPSTVLTERSQLDDADMGHQFSAPEVGRLAGQWFMFYGNGAHSSGGKAVLFATNLSTGQNLRLPIETSQGGNGLMGVRLLLNRSTREVEALYGGDLRGNLWRVDFGPGTGRSANPSDWRVGFQGKPLFTARSGSGALQPITVKPALADHYLGGRMVLFGTGKLFDVQDPDDRTMQSFYGVRDETAEGASAATTDLGSWTQPPNHRSRLQQQKIAATEPVSITDPNTGQVTVHYRSSQETLEWLTERGWFFDLILKTGSDNAATASGQRVIDRPVMIGEFVWIQSMVPADAPKDCATASGVGYNFLLPAVTGAMHDKPVIDTNGDGKVDDQDQVTSGIQKNPADGDDVVLAKGTPDGDGDGLPDDPAQNEFKICNTLDCNDVRVYCLFQGCTLVIKDRVWKQLVNPPRRR